MTVWDAYRILSTDIVTLEVSSIFLVYSTFCVLLQYLPCWMDFTIEWGSREYYESYDICHTMSRLHGRSVVICHSKAKHGRKRQNVSQAIDTYDHR